MTTNAGASDCLVRSTGLAAGLVGVLLVVTGILTGCSNGSAHAINGCFRYAAATDRLSYSHSSLIGLTVIATNVSSHDCLGHHCGGVTDWFEVRNSAGKQIYRTNPVGIACARVQAPAVVVAPRRTEIWTRETWDQLGQQIATCKPQHCDFSRPSVPRGRYRITWHWLESVSISTPWFRLTGR